MLPADRASGTHNNAGCQKLLFRRVEEIDVALLVVVDRETIPIERQIDLAIGNRGLDLYRIYAGDLTADLPARGGTTVWRGVSFVDVMTSSSSHYTGDTNQAIYDKAVRRFRP